MCGIVGYYGSKNAVPIIIEGLKRLEYRGYDSAGIALLKDHALEIIKTKGKIIELQQLANDHAATIGVGHTRWATHGEPSHVNAHPHTSMDGTIAIVHNGIIENHSDLRKELQEKHGVVFASQTDSEVIAHLTQFFYKGDFEQAFRTMLTKIEGAFGIVAVHKNHSQILCARKGSPLVIGVGDSETFVASDPSPFLDHTKNVVYLNEKQMAVIDEQGHHIKDFNGFNIELEMETVPYGIEAVQKQGYEHFMLKEIHEQPESIRNCFCGKIRHIDTISINKENIKRIVLVACGTSYYSSLVGKYILERCAHIPVTVEHASEFRYRKPMLYSTDLVVAVSQSGETADTLEAIRLSKKLGCQVAGIVNVTGSSIAKECGQGMYLHAGPEIGVASTKAFTSQIVAFALLGLYFSNDPHYRAEVIEDLEKLPDAISEFLDTNPLQQIAETYSSARYFLFLGRDVLYPVALEGALKLKEICYVPAEGYPAGEMKHGPLALIDSTVPVIFLVSRDMIYEKVISNMEEVKSRKGKIICICDEETDDIKRLSDAIIHVPRLRFELSAIGFTIPLQLFAYYVARSQGREIDQPRNLAKAVTVE